MTIHILVEGPSERAFLDRWGPRLLRDTHIKVHPHQGKGSLPKQVGDKPDLKARGLLNQLPAKLRGFASSLDPRADGVLVLLDADNDDVRNLAGRIMEVAEQCASQLQVRVSIAVEEMEAFYLGDLGALERAYPAADMAAARNYVPDSICGTWELFGRIVGDGGGNKVAWGEAMGAVLTTNPARSRSPSFRQLVEQVRSLVPPPPAARKRGRYHHRAKPRK